MEKTTDIAMVGGGLASFAAAVELAKSGLEVTLVQKAPGMTALSSGAWDLCDSPIRYAGQDLEELPTVSTTVRDCVRRFEHHPFRVFSEKFPEGGLATFLQESAVRAAREFPLTMAGDVGDPLAMVTEMGTIKPTALVQASMAGANVREMDRAKVLVVGIEGLAQFHAGFIAKALEAWQQEQRNSYLEFVGSTELKLSQLSSQASLSSVEIAQFLDREENLKTLSQQLIDALQDKVYTHVLLPAVLGMTQTDVIVSTLQKETGLTVAEILAVPTSVPGWRVADGIERYFKNQGYDHLRGEVVGFDSEGRKVTSLRIHQGEARIRLRAKQFILATGKFLSGGIQGAKPLRESIFNLPLWSEGQRVQDEAIWRLARPTPGERQPFLSVGIRTNAQAQPLDPAGEVAYENLFAAGSLLTGFDPAHDRCMAGVDILSGTIAARGAVS